jgi:hypothetical protein
VSLEKVLRLAGQPEVPAAPEAEDLVRAVAGNLDRIALLLAGKAPPKGGDDDGDGPPWMQKGKGKPMPKKGKKKPKASDDDEDEDDDEDQDDDEDEDVAACRALVLESMVALSGVQGGEHVSLSVLTQAEREKPSAHTIAGSTDYPIPDAVHLAAAVARYKQGKYAGHKPDEIRRHILSRARALGKQVDLDGSDEQVAATALGAVLTLARGYNPEKFPPGKEKLIPMDHGPFTGPHEHAHRMMDVHSHVHMHNGDSRHECGSVYPSAVY